MRAPVLFLARAGLAQSCTGLRRLLSLLEESHSGKNLRRRSIPALAGRPVLRTTCQPLRGSPPRVRVDLRPRRPEGHRLAPTRRQAVRLPGRLRYPRNLSPQSQSAEAQPAKAELAQIGARASAQLAAVVLARRELGLLVVLGDAGCSGHCFLYLSLRSLATPGFKPQGRVVLRSLASISRPPSPVAGSKN